MTPQQLKAALSRLGWSYAKAGKALGVSRRTVIRWAMGDSKIPKAVELLLAKIKCW